MIYESVIGFNDPYKLFIDLMDIQVQEEIEPLNEDVISEIMSEIVNNVCCNIENYSEDDETEVVSDDSSCSTEIITDDDYYVDKEEKYDEEEHTNKEEYIDKEEQSDKEERIIECKIMSDSEKISSEKNNRDITIIVACMNREKKLKTAMRSWNHKRIKEIIIIDWSSDIPIKTKYKKARIIRVNGEQNWRLTWAYNFALTFVKTSYVLKLDCDIILHKDFFNKHPIKDGIFYSGEWSEGRDRNEEHLHGQLFISKKDLEDVSGYNEFITTYGWDDSDLYQRLINNDIERNIININTMTHIHGTDYERALNQNIDHLHLDKEIQRNRALAKKNPWKQTIIEYIQKNEKEYEVSKSSVDYLFMNIKK